MHSFTFVHVDTEEKIGAWRQVNIVGLYHVCSHKRNVQYASKVY